MKKREKREDVESTEKSTNVFNDFLLISAVVVKEESIIGAIDCLIEASLLFVEASIPASTKGLTI